MNSQESSHHSSVNGSNFPLKTRVFYLFLVAFTALVFYIFFKQRSLSSFSGYVFQEWLINYSQGFVRRGLPGTILLFLHKYYDLSIYQTIKYFSYFIFLIFSGIYLLKVKKSIRVIDWEALAFLLLSPALLFFPLNDLGVIGRKEFFFFLGLLINLFLFERILRPQNAGQNTRDSESGLREDTSSVKAANLYCQSMFVWYNLLAVPTALSHEAILFLGLPSSMLVTLTAIGSILPGRRALWRTLLVYSPTIFVSLLCFVFNGNGAIALGICQTWEEFYNQAYNLSINCQEQLPTVLTYLDVSTGDAIRKVWTDNVARQQGQVFFSWMFALCLNAAVLMHISSRVLTNSLEQFKAKSLASPEIGSTLLNAEDLVAKFSFKYAVLPFIGSSILYAIALDWGRWFFIVAINYVLCLLTPGLIHAEAMSGDRQVLPVLSSVYAAYSRAIRWLYTLRLPRGFTAVYWLVLVYMFFLLRIPHWNMKPTDLYYGSFVVRGLMRLLQN